MKNFIYISVLISGVFLGLRFPENLDRNGDTNIAAAEKKFRKTFPASIGGRMELITDIGSVNLIGTESQEMIIEATIRGDEEFTRLFEISAEQKDGRIQVTGKADNRQLMGGGNNIQVQFLIHVPVEFNVFVSTSAGNISAEGIRGTLHGKTSGGNIRLSAIRGEMDVKTSGGNLRLNRLDGILRAKTSGGNISADSLTGDLELKTSGGSLNLFDLSGKVDAITSGGHIQASLISVTQPVRLETSGGDIQLAIPSETRAEIDASTSGGEVLCALPVTITGKLRAHKLTGSINGGGPRIDLKTSGGDIVIKKR